MKFLRLFTFLFFVITVNSEIFEEEDSEKSKLPVLLKTLRLRTFSLKDGKYDYVRPVHLRQLRLRPTIIKEESSPLESIEENPTLRNIERRSLDNLDAEESEEGLQNEKLPGRGMIGRNRHPKVHEKELRLRPTTINGDSSALENLEEDRTLRSIRRRSLQDLDDEENKYSNLKDAKGKKVKIEGDAEGKVFKIVKDVEKGDLKIHEDIEGGEIKLEGDLEEDEGELKNEKLPGWGLIGKHRHPKIYRHKVLSHPVPKFDKARRRPFWKYNIPCGDNRLQELKQCVADYFENFEISLVEDKLPSILEVHEQMSKFDNYDENKEFHEAFKNCYKTIPKKCFESKNVEKIIINPDEKNVYSSLLTLSEFIFKSEKYEKDINCFLQNLESLPSVEAEDSEEEKIQKCRRANLAIQRARDEYRKKCINSETSRFLAAAESEEVEELPKPSQAPQFRGVSRFPNRFRHPKSRDSEMDEWFVPFFKRQSVGEFCPPLFHNRKALPHTFA